MATITQIEIEGFKAFPKNFKLDLGTGKNLLLYGENGSGKSSLYYALHALLQSVFKDDKGAKYFKPGDTNGEEFIINNEHLINIFRFNEAKDNTYTPYVRITFDDGKIWRLDNGGLSSENGGNDMASGVRNKIILACTECKQRNYNTMKNKRNNPDRIELMKYCKFCNKETLHKETK